MKKGIEPSDFAKVSTLAGLGLRNQDIAAFFGMSEKTFRRRVSEDETLKAALDEGRALASEKVAETAFDMATSGKHPVMTIFWLKCRLQWKDTQVIEHTGPDGDAIETKHKLSTAELAEIARLARVKK